MAHFTVSDNDQSVSGSAFDDVFTIDGDRDTISAGEGHDILNAHGVGDVLHGETGVDWLADTAANLASLMDGGEGDDRLTGHVSDTLLGGDGVDSFIFSVNGLTSGVRANFSGLGSGSNDLAFSWGEFAGLEDGTLGGTTHDDVIIASTTNAMTLFGDDGNDRLVGGDTVRDVLIGGAGDDRIKAGAAGAMIYAFDDGGQIETRLGVGQAVDLGADRDVMRGSASGDSFYAGYGSEVIDAGDGVDSASFIYLTTVSVSINLATGHSSNSAGDHYKITSVENLTGGALGDRLVGTDDANRLEGGGGGDVLQGGLGRDGLVGGAGADTFVYHAVSDSPTGASDTIFDGNSEDSVDLHRIDADATHGGNQAFTLVEAFDGHAAELVVSYDFRSDQTTIAADTDGDGSADMTVVALGDMRGADFIL